MRQSNLYVILFSAILTVVLGGLLAWTSVALKPLQNANVELDTKTKILGAAMDISNIKDGKEILSIYDKKVKSFVVDINGKKVEKDKKGNAIVAENLDVRKNSKLPDAEKCFPVYMLLDDKGEVESYVFALYGNGLWDAIWGYIALEADLNSIKGTVFDHKAETPGLGARITDAEIQGRFKNKKVYDTSGSLVSVVMMKGEGSDYGNDPHKVDGMSGATMTAKGVNAMIKLYLTYYNPFIQGIIKGKEVASIK